MSKVAEDFGDLMLLFGLPDAASNPHRVSHLNRLGSDLHSLPSLLLRALVQNPSGHLGPIMNFGTANERLACLCASF